MLFGQSNLVKRGGSRELSIKLLCPNNICPIAFGHPCSNYTYSLEIQLQYCFLISIYFIIKFERWNSSTSQKSTCAEVPFVPVPGCPNPGAQLPDECPNPGKSPYSILIGRTKWLASIGSNLPPKQGHHQRNRITAVGEPPSPIIKL